MGKSRASDNQRNLIDELEHDNSVYTLGMDLSLNHGAVVQLKDGKFNDCWYVSDYASSADRHENGTRLVLPKTEDRQQLSAWRLQWWSRWFARLFECFVKAKYVGIEDYALGNFKVKGKNNKSASASHGGHYKGELGGQARIVALNHNSRLRLHDPTSVKMFITHNGKAKKPEVEQAVFERLELDFSNCNPPKKKKKKENRQTSEDLADATAVAYLIWTEVRLRRGDIHLSELGHPKEIQVFQRCTKAYPVSILGREWIERLDWSFNLIGT